MAGIDVRVYNQHAFRYAMHNHLSIAYLKAGFVYFCLFPSHINGWLHYIMPIGISHRLSAPSLRERAGGEAMYLLPLEGVRGVEFVTYSDVINIGLPIGEGRVRF